MAAKKHKYAPLTDAERRVGRVVRDAIEAAGRRITLDEAEAAAGRKKLYGVLERLRRAGVLDFDAGKREFVGLGTVANLGDSVDAVEESAAVARGSRSAAGKRAAIRNSAARFTVGMAVRTSPSGIRQGRPMQEGVVSLVESNGMLRVAMEGNTNPIYSRPEDWDPKAD